jgi:transcription elongation factor Elf1
MSDFGSGAVSVPRNIGVRRAAFECRGCLRQRAYGGNCDIDRRDYEPLLNCAKCGLQRHTYIGERFFSVQTSVSNGREFIVAWGEVSA